MAETAISLAEGDDQRGTEGNTFVMIQMCVVVSSRAQLTFLERMDVVPPHPAARHRVLGGLVSGGEVADEKEETAEDVRKHEKEEK